MMKILGFIGLGGISSAAMPWIIGGALIAVAALLGGVWKAGYNYRDAKCDAAAKQVIIEQLEKTLTEKNRQLNEVNRIQADDAERANRAEEQLRTNQENINATPKNDKECLDADAAERINSVGRVRRKK